MNWLTTVTELNAAVLIWVGLAALLEVCFYATLASPRLREAWTPRRLMLSAALPVLIYGFPLHLLKGHEPFVIAGAVGLAACWYKIWGHSRWADAGFIAVMAAPLLFKLFAYVYPRAGEDLRMEFLGQLLWIRAGICTILREQRAVGVNFGFLPSPRDWRIGVAWFAGLLPVAYTLARVTGFAQFAMPTRTWWETGLIALGIFLGILWVVALSEEFVFRGILQPWIGLLGASILFGCVHLGSRAFPNWRFALMAAVAGVFYGMAFRKSGSIRAAMVTHALTVTTLKVFFR
jgi:membrane protease YdiL (CAAX protease family)